MSLKSELKNGAVVELRNGIVGKLRDDVLYGNMGTFIHLNCFDDDLKCINGFGVDNKKYDIVKIYYNPTWERPQEILTEKEKAYLSAVIKPFRDEIEYIKKCVVATQVKYEYLLIKVTDDSSAIIFPKFEQGTMYKGMKPRKEYRPEELGL